ncbi:hypothetical protein M9458_049008, partial [Cirrhinus mrigala]
LECPVPQLVSSSSFILTLGSPVSEPWTPPQPSDSAPPWLLGLSSPPWPVIPTGSTGLTLWSVIDLSLQWDSIPPGTPCPSIPLSPFRLSPLLLWLHHGLPGGFQACDITLAPCLLGSTWFSTSSGSVSLARPNGVIKGIFTIPWFPACHL